MFAGGTLDNPPPSTNPPYPRDQLSMEETQEAQDPPSVVDFDALVLEPTTTNTSGKFCDVYRLRHPQAGLLAVKSPRGVGKPGSGNYRVRV